MSEQDNYKDLVFCENWIYHSSFENKNARKFNQVFLVKNKNSHEIGVCKFLVKTDNNAHLWDLLRQESQITFEQKELPKTLAFEESDKEIILIRKFREGVTLDKFWRTIPRRKQQNFIVRMIEKLVPTFQTLADQKIIHGDLKPTNFIVSGNFSTFEIYLIDFGIAIFPANLFPRKTLFALGYSAPELILNRLKIVNQTTDYFALATTIWHLFAGQLPLTHKNPAVMTNLQITYPLPSHRSMSKEMNEILQKMCFKYVFQRPPNQLDSDFVDAQLKSAMQQRFQSLEEVLRAMKSIKKANWLRRTFGF